MKLICFNAENKNLNNAKSLLTNIFEPFGCTEISCAEFSDIKLFFSSVAKAFESNNLVVLAVDKNAFLKVRSMVFKALAIKTEFNSEIAKKIANNVTDITEKEREYQCFTAKDSKVFLTYDGLYSGFALKRAKQTVMFLPYDENCIKTMSEDIKKYLVGVNEVRFEREEKATEPLQNNAQPEPEIKAEIPQPVAPQPVVPQPILPTAEMEIAQEAEEKEESQPSADELKEDEATQEGEARENEVLDDEEKSENEESIKVEDEEDIPVDMATASIKSLLKNNVKVAVAQTPASPYINTSCMNIEGYFNAFEFTQYNEDRGDTKPTDYVASLAKGALTQAGTLLGTAISKVFTAEDDGETKMFIYVALADEETAKVKRIFANPGEEPLALVGVAVETMYGMILQYIAEQLSADENGEFAKEQSYTAPVEIEPIKKSNHKKLKIFLSILLSVVLIAALGMGYYYKVTGNNLLAVAFNAIKTIGMSQMVMGQVGDEPVQPTDDFMGGVDLIEDTTDESESESSEEETTETTTQPETTKKAETTTKAKKGEETTTQKQTAAVTGKFIVTTYGYGHGVGMSQWGAQYYAKDNGWKYDKILTYYYPGTSLVSDTAPATLAYKGENIDTATIIARVLEAEMGSGFEKEALKAQAVAAYTYIMRNGGKVSGLAVSSSAPSSKALSAAKEVLGISVKYNGSYANTVFYSMSAGKTCPANTVWRESLPYLAGGVESRLETRNSSYKVSKTYTVDEMRSIVEGSLNIKLSDNPASWFSILEHDDAVSKSVGYVNKLSIDGQRTISGHKFRSEVMGYTRMRSHCFTIEYVK
ncbi:MAG: hypothetical protein K5917_02330 [Clostridiales bacterium]|nr:hypothetical protein [Clostridiales bacterium]